MKSASELKVLSSDESSFGNMSQGGKVMLNLGSFKRKQKK